MIEHRDKPRLARTVRRLSTLRLAKFGPPPDHDGVWWSQIEGLAAEHQLPITWEEWGEMSRLMTEQRRYRETTR